MMLNIDDHFVRPFEDFFGLQRTLEKSTAKKECVAEVLSEARNNGIEYDG